jgi:hypothetical protein
MSLFHSFVGPDRADVHRTPFLINTFKEIAHLVFVALASLNLILCSYLLFFKKTIFKISFSRGLTALPGAGKNGPLL